MKKIIEKIKQSQLQQYSLCAILILAAILRFTGLTRRDFWYDEAFTGVAIKENFSDMIAMIINDVHPPLYYIALKGFSYFFDYSVFGIRLFSAIFGLASVWALYLLTKELFNIRAARYAALVAAISPFALQYSQEARMYAMLVFFILMGSYFFVKGLKTNERKYFLAWGFLTGLSMLTHYMGIIFSSLYYPAFAVWNIGQLENIAGSSWQRLQVYLKKIIPSKQIIFGYALAIVTFLPWLKMFIYHVSMKGNNLSWVKPASLGDFITNVQMFLFGTPLGEMSSGMPQPNELHGIAHISVRMVLALLLGMGIAYLMRKESKVRVLMVLTLSFGFMFVIYAMSMTMSDQQYFVARYLLPGAFFIFIFVGLWLSKLRFPVVVGIFGVYLYLLSLIIPLANSQGWNEITLHMDKYKNNDLYILNSFDYVIAKYYLGADNLTLYNYDWPGYNPSYWAAIGNSIKRLENFEDLLGNPRALIISNKPLVRDNQYFSTQGLVLVDQYKNILVYRYQR